MKMFIGMKSLLPMSEAVEGCCIESINIEKKTIELDEQRFYRWNAPQGMQSVIDFIDQFSETQSFVVYIKLNAYTTKEGDAVEFLNIVGLQTQEDFDNNGMPTVQTKTFTDKKQTIWRKKGTPQTGDATPTENNGQTDPNGNPNTPVVGGVIVTGQQFNKPALQNTAGQAS